MSSHLFRLSDYRRPTARTYFDRQELSCLLGLYHTRVSAGEWRDYALDHRPGLAIFSVFRHTHDRPLFAIVKHVSANGRPAEFALFQGRERLSRAGTLAETLDALDRIPRLVR